MFYVYILKSKLDDQLYIGSTNDLKRRFFLHNSKKVPSTAPRAPFNLVYYEAYASENDARKRESALKLRDKRELPLFKELIKVFKILDFLYNSCYFVFVAPVVKWISRLTSDQLF